MRGRSTIPESVLVRIWAEQRFAPDGLQTTRGLPIQVIRCGWRNTDNGPDFKEALIRIGDETYAGDVELHLEVADWRAHGHDTDPSYNQLILHAVLWEPHSKGRRESEEIRKANGESVPTVIVCSCLSTPLDDLIDVFQRFDERKQQKLKICRATLGKIPIEQMLSCLQNLGKERLSERAWRFETWLEADDYQQVLYIAICEGLGYTSNKRPFIELARRLPLAKIYPHLPADIRNSPQACLHWLQAILFGVAGLLPGVQTLVCRDPGVQNLFCRTPGTPNLFCKETNSETTDYLTELRSLWEMLAPCLDVAPLKPEDWHFFRLRPPNFPTRRIAALSYLVFAYRIQPLFESYLHLFDLFAKHPDQTAQNIRLLEHTLEVPASGYWQGRYLFGDAVFPDHDRMFLGQSRIRDILISAVFPVFLLYAQRTQNTALESQLLALYTIFPAPSWNSLTKRIYTQLLAQRDIPLAQIRTAAIYQGLLHLAKHYCYLPACNACPFAQ